MSREQVQVLMGPPTPGPVFRVVGRAVSVTIRVETDDDREILRLALEMAERRRYGRADSAGEDV